MASNLKSFSLAFLPFNIVPLTAGVDPFDNSIRISDVLLQTQNTHADAMRNFLQLLNTKARRTAPDGLFDPTKYHNYTQTALKFPEKTANQEVGFLEVYDLDLNTLSGEKADGTPMKFSSYCSDGKVSLRIGASGLKFKIESIRFIINELTHTGYLVIRFDWDESGQVLEDLSQIDFFRFYRKDERQNAYKLTREKSNKKQGGEVEIETETLSLFDLMDIFFRDLHTGLRYVSKRPVMLHISADKRYNEMPETTIKRLCYNLLRIPKKDTSTDQAKHDKLNAIIKMHFADEAIAFCTMNEGCVILDSTTEGGNSSLNKYFFAFIIALNQREAMIIASRMISEIRDKDIHGHQGLSHVLSEQIFETLRKMNRLLNLIQLKQVMYSISFYNEVSLFFRETQNTFDISTLLRDNKESIEEIHKLLESEHSERLAVQDSKREASFNIFFGVLSLLGIISAFTDLFAFLDIHANKWLLFPTLLLVLTGYIYLWKKHNRRT